MLTKRTHLFERLFPNIIQFASDCGGILEVLFFGFYVIGLLHHYILFDQSVINEAILSREKELDVKELPQEIAEVTTGLSNIGIHSKKFTYFEILKYKFFPCCTKKNDRFK
jgi:hypothetical protein